jgi:DNA-binding transcriptional LysR family regulator
MRIQQLIYLTAVIQHGSFRKAAKQLGVSQPTLTDQIRRLEEELDVVLLNRGHAGIAPTSQAEVLLPHIGRVIENARSLTEEASALGGLRVGTVRVGSSPTLSNALLCHAIRKFRLTYPNIRFEAIEAGSATVAEGVASGDLDIGLLTSADASFGNSHLITRQILADKIVVCMPAGHRFSKAKSVGIAELADDPWIVYGRDYTLRTVFEDLTRAMSINVAYQSTSASTMIRMVANNVGVALATALAISVSDTEDRRKVVALDLRLKALPSIGGFIVRRRDHLPTPAGREFERVLRNEVSQLAHLRAFRYREPPPG